MSNQRRALDDFIAQHYVVEIDAVVLAVRLSPLRNTYDAPDSIFWKYDIIHKTVST